MKFELSALCLNRTSSNLLRITYYPFNALLEPFAKLLLFERNALCTFVEQFVKPMKLSRLLLLLIVCTSFSVFGQEMKITGTVYDTTGTKPLLNAMVMAVRMKDSVLLGFTRSDANGLFDLKGIQKDTFSLVFSHPQSDDKTYFIFGNDENMEINIPSVRMPAKSQLIDEVVIYAYKDPIYYKGDTLVYVADSFKVGENAVVEDLLKKLPGIEVDKDGKIKSQGQEITKVLVDGDEFFGSDPTIATKNLGAKGVESVQVYEKENEDGTFGSDEKIKVLDLKLKDDAKKGYFGRISGASDFGLTQGTPFYEGELLLNKFNGSQKISVFALGSNTPRSGFGWGDVNKFGLDNETPGGNRWTGGNQTNTSGIPQTLKAGVYYSDKFGKKRNGKIGFNYSFYNTELDATSASRSQYFLSDTTYYTDDSTRNFTKNQSHNFNVNFETKFDSLTKIYIKPSIRFDFAENDKTDLTDFVGEDGVQSLFTNVRNASKSDGMNFATSVGIERKFMKPKREITADYYINIIDNNTDGNLLSQTTFTANPAFSDTIDQSKKNNNDEIKHSIYADYTEPFGKFIRMTVGYNLTLNTLNQDKSTYDYSSTTSDYTSFRSDLSNVFRTDRIEHRGGVRFLYEKPKHVFYVRLDARNVQIENTNKITGNDINQNVSNFLPIVEYEYKPSMSKRFNARYTTNSVQPSLSDLQPVLDNSNPNRIQIGNQDLKPNYVHNLNINFNTWSALSGRYIWSGIYGSLTDNAFANSTSYDAFGRTISQTINVDGNTNVSLYAGGGFPFFNRKLIIQPSANGSYNHYTNFINSQKNVTDNLAIGLNLEVRLEFDSLEFAIGNAYNYNNPKSSLSSVSNTPYSFQQYYARFSWRLPKGFTIQTDCDYNINGQRADGYNISYFILNAELSKSFLKTENLVLSLIGKDMFNQNVNAQRQVSGNVVVDNRTKIISRYFLLKLTFRFNNNKTKEQDGHGWY